MFFKRIELNGFKSFADPVSIELTEGITAIVGPNGSGKSNISDALKWVLGEQSPKSLRGGKMEDVIFAGTETRKAKGMAEVTLVIDNSEHILPLDFNEIGITRRMYRSGDSEYMINRTPCRLRDIRELIMDTGIGVEGYSIIGQGKIADIISNKMESRREIFEEAAGIVKYRTRKESAEKNLASATDNLARVNDIVFEIESRIDGLREDSEKASEYLEISKKYKDVEINIILKNVQAAQTRCEAAQSELDELEARLTEQQDKRSELDGAISAARSKAESLEERLNGLRDELAKKTEEIHFIGSRDELNKERLQSLDRDDERLGAEIEALKEKEKRQEEILEGYSRTLEETRAEQAGFSAKLAESAALLEKADRELAEAESEFEKQRDALYELTASQSSAKLEIQSMESLKGSLQRRADRLEEDGDGREGSLKQLRDRLAEKEVSGTSLEESEQSIRKDLNKASNTVAEAEVRISQENAKLQELSLEQGRISARLKLLEELESSYEGYGGAVRYIMKQNIPGIRGVLGELIQVPKGWELAIETVLGAQMQNIVCDSEETAKEAIELLKREKAGRLTFLPMDSLRPGKNTDVSELEGLKGFRGLAADSVKCSLKGAGSVIDYLLGRVLVADSLDDAIKISKKAGSGARVVTLEGELINSAGAITGGRQKNNTANILSRKAEKEALEESLAAAAEGLEKAAAAKKQAESRLGEAQARRDIFEHSLRDKELEKALLEKEIEQIRLMEGDALASEEKRKEELEELAKEISAADVKLAELRASLESMEDAISAQQDRLRLMSAENEVLKASQQKASEEANRARLEESSFELKLESAQERCSAVRQQIRELQDEIDSKAKDMDKNDVQRKQIADFGDNAAQILSEKEEEKKSLEAESERLSADRKAAVTEADGLDEERRALESGLYDLQMEKHDADLKLAKAVAQIDSMKEKLFDEFELSYAQAAELEDPDFVMSRGLKESREYRDRIRALGNVNVGAIEEYKAVSERYGFLTEQKNDILKAIEELRTVIDETDSTIKARFKESFEAVVDNFEKTFSELFSGGHAKLSLEDPDNPMESAIEIEAQPPGKRLQNINLLSGGEKTMTAIALMFAVLKAKPTPFCILDEVEAALDENNINRFATALRGFDKTQFALVTHQKATMEHADVMYGITMAEHGVSKVLSLRLDSEFEF